MHLKIIYIFYFVLNVLNVVLQMNHHLAVLIDDNYNHYSNSYNNYKIIIISQIVYKKKPMIANLFFFLFTHLYEYNEQIFFA